MPAPFKVFYSWQSDSPSKTNRGLIQEALDRAARAIARDPEVEVVPVIDRDTKGEGGSPSISETILRKIDECDMVVADVTIIGAVNGRPTSNPNVLFELGYAVRAKGWDLVVPVCNTGLGRVEDLPFDLRHRRVCTYAMSGDEQPASARAHLVGAFEAAIRGAMLPGSSARATTVRISVDDPSTAERLQFRLSSHAQTLLLEAAQDRNGTVMYLRVLGGDVVTTNDKNLFEHGSVREQAAWTAAFTALTDAGLFREEGYEGQMFCVTELGFRVADQLSGLPPA